MTTTTAQATQLYQLFIWITVLSGLKTLLETGRPRAE